MNGPFRPCGIVGEWPALSGAVRPSAGAASMVSSTAHCLLGVPGWTPTAPPLWLLSTLPPAQPNLHPHPYPGALGASSQGPAPSHTLTAPVSPLGLPCPPAWGRGSGEAVQDRSSGGCHSPGQRAFICDRVWWTVGQCRR